MSSTGTNSVQRDLNGPGGEPVQTWIGTTPRALREARVSAFGRGHRIGDGGCEGAGPACGLAEQVAPSYPGGRTVCRPDQIAPCCMDC